MDKIIPPGNKLNRRGIKIIFLAVLNLCICTALIGQNTTKIDSLNYRLTIAKNAEDSLTLYCNLSWNTSWDKPKECLFYGQKALELTSRTSNPRQISEAYDAAALGYRVSGDTSVAKKYYLRSLKIAEDNNISERIAWCKFSLSSIFFNEGNYIKSFDYALASRTAFLETNSRLMAASVNRIIITTCPDSRKKLYDTLLYDITYELEHTKDPDLQISLYENLMIFYNKLENKAQSMQYALKTLEIAEKSNNLTGIIKASFHIGRYLRDYQHNYDIALKYYNRILKINEDRKDEAGVASLLVEIGDTHKLKGNDSLALIFYNKSLGISERINHRHSKSSAYESIGNICFTHHNYEDAIAYYSKCYDTGCDICSKIEFHHVLVNIGKVYLKISDYENALKYYNLSLQLAESFGSLHEEAVSYAAFAGLYGQKNDFPQSIAYFQQALVLVEKSGTLSLKKEITQELSNLYNKSGNYKKAYQYLGLSEKYSDSLNNVNQAENISHIETRFEFQNIAMQNELEKVKANEQIKSQKQLKSIFIISSLFLLAIGIILLFGIRRKKRDNRILEIQKSQIAEMSEKVHQSDRMKLRFFTNISHELRTPLTLIYGLTEELLSNTKTDNANSKQLSIIKRNTSRLVQMVNQVLDLRKLDNKSMKIEVIRGNITTFIAGVIALFENAASKKNIYIDFQTRGKEIAGLYDPDKLEKIIGNLLSNAIKYAKNEGKIIVSVFPDNTDNNYIYITVSDDGRGIAPEHVSNIFQPFYQVPGNTNGTGIGLALVKELTELHHGTIRVESNPGKGSIFTILLPVTKSSLGDIKILEKTAYENAGRLITCESISNTKKDEQHTKNTLRLDEKSLLIVEDNDDLREFIAHIFADEYIIYTATDGKEGFLIAKDNIPDIVITDIMMPGTDGYQLCRQLKSQAITSHIPVILLTAKNSQESKLTGFSLGADDYIEKPFTSKLLKARVKNLIDQRRLLIENFSKWFRLQPNEVIIPDNDKEFLEKTIQIIENHISDSDLDIELLASEMAVSRAQLYRKLKALTNYSTNQFIRMIRIKRAAQILEKGQLNISEVMDKIGFSNYSHFNNCFREYFGKSPKEYTKLSSQGISS